jgi:hypothetical protein
MSTRKSEKKPQPTIKAAPEKSSVEEYRSGIQLVREASRYLSDEGN